MSVRDLLVGPRRPLFQRRAGSVMSVLRHLLARSE
jgi:hypothetical protein